MGRFDADDDRAGRWTRVGFVLLAAGQGAAALWALGAPRSFFDDFPGGGRHWVAALPPFNEHLTIDYASGALALTILAVMAAVSLRRSVVTVTAIAWLAFGLPHFVYHLITWDRLPPADAVANALTLGSTVVIPLTILAGARGTSRAGAAAGEAAA